MIRKEALPEGTGLRPLQMLPDERGTFTEIYRREWAPSEPAVQWNLVRSDGGVMRGVKVHPRHDDYLVVADGRVTVGLRDLRRNSPTFGLAAISELCGSALSVLTIPAGVAHGLYTPEPSLFLIGVTRYHDPEDEISCRWDDPALGIPWPVSSARISPSDARGLPLDEVIEIVARRG
jgi:dTDP-4-dehydrorhamnose 3,5-epimerase